MGLVTMLSDPNHREGSLLLTNCQLTGKGTYRQGLVATGLSQINLTNSNFTSHVTDNEGGAVYFNHTDRVSVQGCLFQNNTAKSAGGAMYVQVKNYTQTNCHFNSNRAEEGGDIFFMSTGNNSYAISGSTYDDSDNAIQVNGASANLTVDSLVFNQLQDEAVTCTPDSGAIQNVIFDSKDALGPPDTAANWVSGCVVINGPMPKQSDVGVIVGISVAFVFLCGAVSCTLLVEQIKARRERKRVGYSELVSKP